MVHRQKKRCGFTLAEVMFSIIIIGICMSIVASIFPAAMSINRSSTASILGQIIAENGLAFATTHLAVTKDASGNYSLEGAPANITTQLVDMTPRIGHEDQFYPIGAESKRGYKVLVRQMSPGKNDFLLVVIAYSKAESSNTIEVVQHSTMAVGAGLDEFNASGTLQVNAPLISYDGPWAMIEGIEGNGIDLSHPLSETDILTGMVSIIEKL